MTKISQYTHIDICKKALNDNDTFNNFKQIPAFTYILEHTSQNWGEEYIKLIFKQYGKLANSLDWEKLKENDNFGNSNLVNFSSLKNHLKINNCNYSPSTIYYIYRGLDIINKLLKDDKNINILEIGGGYGGQCKLLIDMCRMLNIGIEKYGIIDLEYASKLQNKYLNIFGHSNIEYFEYENIKEFEVFRKYNKLFSVYALSEFEIDVQDYYIDNIIKYVSNYYILCNAPILNNFFSNDIWIQGLPDTGRYHKLITNK